MHAQEPKSLQGASTDANSVVLRGFPLDGEPLTSAESADSCTNLAQEPAHALEKFAGAWWCNCWVYALWNYHTRGGYLIKRHSHFGWWPHYIWSPDLVTFEEYLPNREGHEKRSPPLIFRGHIRRSTVAEQVLTKPKILEGSKAVTDYRGNTQLVWEKEQ